MSVPPIADRPYVPFLIMAAALILARAVAAWAAAHFSIADPFLTFVVAQSIYWTILLGGVRVRTGRLFPRRHGTGASSAWREGVLFGALLIVVHVLVSSVVVTIATAVFGVEWTQSMMAHERAGVERLQQVAGGGLATVVLWMMAVGLGPLVEELFFRGYVYPVFKVAAGVHAQWMSALIFAAAHLYVLNFVPVFVLGWLLAVLYERTGDVRAPVIAHVTVNGFVALLSFVGRAGV